MNTKELLLSVLMSGPATGYDIKKVLENEVSEVVDVTISNIYPALNELAAEGLVSCERVEQENRPNKKVYAITDAGRKACLHALMTSPARHRLRSEFMFILSFAPYLPKSRLAELVEQRLAEIDETEETLRALDRGEGTFKGTLLPGQKFCIGLGRALIEAERSYIEQNSHWLLAPEREAEQHLELAAH
ncbi:PadR family transcriptional regulator [Parvibaculum sp.]|uniref:PadR family transcriptional regulator n=1 Tax=Parvibaculum sp. TaxID=2024848 RepID=UPI00320CBF81